MREVIGAVMGTPASPVNASSMQRSAQEMTVRLTETGWSCILPFNENQSLVRAAWLACYLIRAADGSTYDISSRKNKLKELSRSNSGIDKLRAIAMTPDVNNPSTPAGVMKCCIFGVNRNGTLSGHLCVGVLLSRATGQRHNRWVSQLEARVGAYLAKPRSYTSNPSSN